MLTLKRFWAMKEVGVQIFGWRLLTLLTSQPGFEDTKLIGCQTPPRGQCPTNDRWHNFLTVITTVIVKNSGVVFLWIEKSYKKQDDKKQDDGGDCGSDFVSLGKRTPSEHGWTADFAAKPRPHPGLGRLPAPFVFEFDCAGPCFPSHIAGTPVHASTWLKNVFPG